MRTDKAIVRSSVEDDLYKFTMLFYFWSREKARREEDTAEYEFICRNSPKFPLSELIPEIREEVQHLCTLSPTYWELNGLRLRGIFPEPEFTEFAAFLRGLRLSLQDIEIRKKTPEEVTKPNCDLYIGVKGALTKTTRFEIPILYIVNELYFRRLQREAGRTDDDVLADYLVHLKEKCDAVSFICRDDMTGQPRNMDVIDFGLRRRYSGAIHDAGLQFFGEREWKVPGINMLGTSNVYTALAMDIKAWGTVAHEYFTAHQAFYRRELPRHQGIALENLLTTFRGKLVATLTDT
jgi:nicotinate phosphoribosyltransferase